MRMCLPLVSCVFVVFPQPYCSWQLLLEWGITSKDCIAEAPAHCGPARTTFRHKSWPERHLQWDQHGMAYANPDLGMEIQWNTLARQKADIGLHSHPIVSRRSTTKDNEWLWQKNVSEIKRMAHETRAKRKQIYLGKQKNVGVTTMENAALNKRESAGKGLELLCGTEESQSENKGNPSEKQQEVAGEDLDLVRETTESHSKDKGHHQEFKRNSVVCCTRFGTGTSDLYTEEREWKKKKKNTAPINRPDRKQNETHQQRNILRKREEEFQKERQSSQHYTKRHRSAIEKMV